MPKKKTYINGKEVKFCENCGKPIYRKNRNGLYWFKKKFCSNTCRLLCIKSKDIIFHENKLKLKETEKIKIHDAMMNIQISHYENF